MQGLLEGIYCDTAAVSMHINEREATVSAFTPGEQRQAASLQALNGC